MLRSLRNRLREMRDAGRLTAIPREERPVVVYSEDTFSYVQFESILARLFEEGWRAAYVTSDPSDPLLGDAPDGMRVAYLDKMLAGYLPRIDSDLFATTMPDLGNLHLRRPPAEVLCLYLFHSLHSIHMVYRSGAFDHYDAFFCTGPYQARELTARFHAIGREPPQLFEVGYPKLDRVAEEHRAYRKRHPDVSTVLVAPSWGAGNVLESHGLELVRGLLDAGFRVVVRPHPCFFLPIYPKGLEIVERIDRELRDREGYVLERTIDDRSSFYEADLLVTGWSGSAFEYAFGTERPALFVDVPRKVFNPDWKDLGLPTFEEGIRERIGEIVPTRDVARIGEVAERMRADQAGWAERLREIRAENVFHFGDSARVGAEVIDGLLRAGRR